MPSEPIKTLETPSAIKVGQVIKIRVMRWDDGWKFDCPVVMLSPRIRVWEDGCSIEHAVESFMIDCVIDGKMPKNEKLWRWPLSYLKNKFYRVEHETVKVEVILDEDGELSWKQLA